jgi:hypothetical protein
MKKPVLISNNSFNGLNFVSIAIITFIFIIIFAVVGLGVAYYFKSGDNNETVKENFENEEEPPNTNKWCVLLTMCVDRFKKGNESDMKERKELYKTQLQKWLEKTELPIFVVESSDNGDFLKEVEEENERITGDDDEIFRNGVTKNERLTCYVFDANERKESSIGEVNSLRYAIERMKENDKYKESTHILKVTGRYFLEDFENKANQLEQDKELYLQPHRDTIYQNSEYFGMKKDTIDEFIDKFDMSILMEENLYNFSLDKEYVVFEPFENSVARGGDNIVLHKL